MSHSTKVMGTRYIAELTYDYDEKALYLQLSIGDVVEEETKISSKSLRAVREGLLEVIKRTNIQVNEFQVDLMSKELYGKLTGDTNLDQHNKDMEEIEKKKHMSQDGSFHHSLASEFKQSFGVQQEEPTITSKPKPKPEIRITPEERSPSGSSQQRPEIQSMVSEINKRVGRPSPTSSGSSPSREVERSPPQHVDTTITSVDVEDLIKELDETKFALMEDLNRINLRMEKIDAIIAKLKSMSKRF